jgi:hypothetical protein
MFLSFIIDDFKAAVAPLDFTLNDLNMASLPTQRAANDEGGDG